MLARLILVLLQFAIGWFAGPMVMEKLPSLGNLNIFVYAIVFAIITWLVGVLGALVLKDVARPSPTTLAFALIGGLVCGGLTKFPDVTTAINGVIGGVPLQAYPLIGAVIGYALKR